MDCNGSILNRESDNGGGSNDDDSVAMEDDESYLPEFAISNYDRGQRGLQQQQTRLRQAHTSGRIHSPSWDGLKAMIEDADQLLVDLMKSLVEDF